MLRIMTRCLCVLLLVLSLSALLLSVSGCGQFYKMVGLSPSQATTQTAADQAEIIHTIEQARDTFWPIVNGGIAVLATVISGWLGLALKKEKAISRTMITGIELSGSDAAKQGVFLASTAAGNSGDVTSRVSKLTQRTNTPVVSMPNTGKDSGDIPK